MWPTTRENFLVWWTGCALGCSGYNQEMKYLLDRRLSILTTVFIVVCAGAFAWSRWHGGTGTPLEKTYVSHSGSFSFRYSGSLSAQDKLLDIHPGGSTFPAVGEVAIGTDVPPATTLLDVCKTASYIAFEGPLPSIYPFSYYAQPDIWKLEFDTPVITDTALHGHREIIVEGTHKDGQRRIIVRLENGSDWAGFETCSSDDPTAQSGSVRAVDSAEFFKMVESASFSKTPVR